ncbi:MAG: tetratricopeptide repeat protein [Emticicia sp.]|uniref:tetratricopeptide repeat protein n=1 Tax=Emticicia sp. TaxID=1930953 RepID=UPI003BA625D4
MKILFYIHCLIITFNFSGFAQRCNHANQIQNLYSQLTANGFDTQKPVAYHYFFIDSNEQDLNRLKDILQQQHYKYVRISKTSGKYQLELEKIEAHNAASATQKGKWLNELAKANNVETFDGFEIFSEENNTETDDLNTFKQQIEKTPTAELYKKALELYDKNEDAKALIVFDRCIKQNINLETSYYKRANCKTALGRPIEAIIDLENVLRLNPQHYEANYNVGGLYFDAKNYDKAAGFYQKAVAINPKSDNGFYRLAETYQYMGMKNAALQNCQKALQLNPNNEYAKKLINTLR